MLSAFLAFFPSPPQFVASQDIDAPVVDATTYNRFVLLTGAQPGCPGASSRPVDVVTPAGPTKILIALLIEALKQTDFVELVASAAAVPVTDCCPDNTVELPIGITGVGFELLAGVGLRSVPI